MSAPTSCYKNERELRRPLGRDCAMVMSRTGETVEKPDFAISAGERFYEIEAVGVGLKLDDESVRVLNSAAPQ